MGRSRRMKIRIGRYAVWEWRGAILALSFALAALYAPPARAGDVPQGVELAFDMPSTAAPDDALAAPKSFVHPVSSNVLAAQRGSGSVFALPLVSTPTQPSGIILWDELKPAQSQNVSTPGGQSVNQINIQIR
jgi:hypothetical protein